jgi:hypothetical protein
MAYSTVGTHTASVTPIKATWLNGVRSNQEDHETRMLALEGKVLVAEVAVSSAELLALRATPKTLVAAPGAGYVLEFVSAVLLLDATATAYVESSANLAVRYTGTTGAKVSEDIEATGFIDQTADTMTTARAKLDAIVAKTGCENQLLCLHNLGAGEYTTGTGTMRVKVSYRKWATGW